MGDKKKGDKLSYFVHCLPRFHELIGKSGAVRVRPGKCLIHLNGTKVILPVKAGDPINKKALSTRRWLKGAGSSGGSAGAPSNPISGSASS